ARIDGVELGRRVIGRACRSRPLVRTRRRGGGDDGGGALRKRLGQRAKRHLRVVRPAIRIAVAQGEVPVVRSLDVGNRAVVIGGEAEQGVELGLGKVGRAGHWNFSWLV